MELSLQCTEVSNFLDGLRNDIDVISDMMESKMAAPLHIFDALIEGTLDLMIN